jgi:hypothetical protein
MKSTYAAALALLLCAGGAFATEYGAGTLRADDFASMDKDGDGYIGENEMKGNQSSQLKKLDTDKDGSLSESEFSALESVRGGTQSASDRSPED